MAYRTVAWFGLTIAASVYAWPEVPLVPVPPLPLGVPNTSAATVVTASSPLRITSADQLVRLAREQIERFDSYIVRLTRREAINGEMQPEEVMLFRHRAKPWSVYLKWLGKEGKGREVVFVKGQHDNKIHSLLSAGDIPFMPAGKRMALSPDNILVRSACRHPLEEAGIAASVQRIGRLLANTQSDPRKYGTLRIVGPQKRAEFEQPVYGLEHTLPAGLDPTLERGGKRTYYFHPETHLPMLICAYDDANNEVEYYHYDRLQQSVKLDDHDFNPDLLWGKPDTQASR